MTLEEACRILGVSPGAEFSQIKKKYRRLMHQLHPDVQSTDNRYIHHVQQINIAYSTLKKNLTGSSDRAEAKEKNPFSPKTDAWDAPVNEHAYREREILYYAEDHDGEVIGTFCIARGKYFWNTEEDFPLFLRSIYTCGKELLDEIDASLGRASAPACRYEILASLVYLLAQQYIDGTSLLKELAAKVTGDRDGQPVYYFTAMLESAEKTGSFMPDEPLYPSGLRAHRLYLKDSSGREKGYLSFQDDRLYYIIVPLFEQRRVLVRIRTSHAKTASYQPLHLWLKIKADAGTQLPESLNLQIGRLLEKYRQS